MWLLGGIYDQEFLAAVQPLYDMHMGVENMGPLLYSLIRFHKPRHVLEVGAGYFIALTFLIPSRIGFCVHAGDEDIS